MLLEKFFPPLDTISALEPEELAIPLLKCLLQEEKANHRNILLLHNFIGTIAAGCPKDKEDEVLRAITEAWTWLEREGMIAPLPRQQGLIYVTRRGEKLAADDTITKYLSGNLIPKKSLDPVLADKVLHLFVRGDYDTAVFQAFKEVEIRVRQAASLSQDLVGVELMRTAFHSDTGKLTDRTRPRAEQEATSHLFAGAVGLLKNPSSHRDVNWENPIECAELIYLANHLLRIVGKHAERIQLP